MRANSVSTIARFLTLLVAVPHLTCNNASTDSTDPTAIDRCTPLMTAPTPVDPTVPVRLYDISTYLFTRTPGEFNEAPQQDIEASVIDPEKISVLVGNVVDNKNQPLGCVKVRILGEPKYGYTQTNGNGQFNMAVNGSSTLTVMFERKGFLPVQRRIVARSQDYSRLPEVVLLPLASEATHVDLTSLTEPALVHGATSSDASGQRQALLMVRPGTNAKLRLQDGSLQDVSSLNFHIVEYTQGDKGPSAMPGTLPSASAYTYAIDIWPDEALNKAISVEFSQPVYSYVENFLNFQVGVVVPSGYYSQQKGEWIGGKNGRVIKVLSKDRDMAVLDTTGRGLPAQPDQLVALGITNEERRILGATYKPGQTFWRVPLDHLTPWDYNWPYGPPPDATYPRTKPSQESTTGTCDQNPGTAIPPEMGSVILCNNLASYTRVPIDGSPFGLVYRSDRATGYYAASKIVAPVSGSYVPQSLQAIELDITIAGNRLPMVRLDRQGVPDLTNQTIQNAKIWDGLDVTRRPMNQPWPATVRVSYVYDGYYYATKQAQIDQWGRFPSMVDGTEKTATNTREAIRLWNEWTLSLGIHKPDGLGFGGMGIDQYHEYDPTNRVLYLGNGDEQKIEGQLALFSETHAGTGRSGYSSGGHVATDADFNAPTGLATNSVGNVYVGDAGNHYIRSIIGGVVEPYAGGTGGYASNPEFAAGGHVDNPTGVLYGFDGNVYLADKTTNYVRVIKKDAVRVDTLYTIAGNAGDADPGAMKGHPMSQPLGKPFGLAMYKQRVENPKVGGPVDYQSLFISDIKNHRIRMIQIPVDPDYVAGKGDSDWRGLDPQSWVFTISAVVGTGSTGTNDGPAATAGLNSPAGLAVAQAHRALFIADSGNHIIRRVDISDPDPTKWTMQTVAGVARAAGYTPGTTSAAAARFDTPLGVAVSPDERYLYITDSKNHRVRRLNMTDSSGVYVRDPAVWTVITVAGTDNPTGAATGCATPTSRQAADLKLSSPSGIAAAQDAIYVADTNNHCIRRLYFNAGFGTSQDSLSVLGSNGDRFIFEKDPTDPKARLKHSQTFDPTGKPKYRFIHGACKQLQEVRDGTGMKLMQVIRDAMTCKLDYLVGAGGERTNLILAGADNFIQTVSNTAYKWNFTFPNSNHLADIVSLTELGSGTTVASTKLQYDSLGRLKQVTVTNMKNPMMPVSMTTNLTPN